MSRAAKLGLAAVMALAMMAAQWPSSADADLIWCWNDPTLVVNGTTVHFRIGVPVEQRKSAAGHLIVTVPSDVQASLSGANAINFPSTVVLRRSGASASADAIPVTATATVDGPSGMPTVLRVSEANGREITTVFGTAGSPMHASFTMRPRLSLPNALPQFPVPVPRR